MRWRPCEDCGGGEWATRRSGSCCHCRASDRDPLGLVEPRWVVLEHLRLLVEVEGGLPPTLRPVSWRGELVGSWRDSDYHYLGKGVN